MDSTSPARSNDRPDRSNGYEGIAPLYIKGRGRATNGIGVSTVRNWARTLTPGSEVLDLGCGTGMPVTYTLVAEGLTVYGVDASPAMASAFRQNFPDLPIACEPVEESSFFNRSFDAIISWGLIFLTPVESQIALVHKMAAALKPGGKLLFTSPPVPIQWQDAMTDQWSRSLGADKYEELISSAGLSLIAEFEDEGENHYYHAIKMLG
jgi:SAM-dependent methyltransferase